MSIIVNTNKQ